MRHFLSEHSTRRHLLKSLAGGMLAAWPGIAHGGPLSGLGLRTAANLLGGIDGPDDDVISSVEDAINVLDFEAAARKKLPPAHFGYLATGVDAEATLNANREGFTRYQLRVRRLVDVRKVDMSVRLFGTAHDSPIIIAPVGSLKAFHPEGELAVARAAQAKKHLQILSTQTTTSVEDVTAARGEPVWYQLYSTDDWNVTQGMVKRAQAAGCPVLVLTVDLNAGSNRETSRRLQRLDQRQCTMCHGEQGFQGSVRRKPMFDGLDVSKVTSLSPASMNWDFVKRLKDSTTMKLAVKGLVTGDDAQLAMEHGVDAIVVSNHGGRAEESGRATVESLPEVVEAVSGRIPVIVDGGFRRGTDILKALALGASAVAVGRPYCWGLASFGQPGVEAVLTILRRELQIAMRQAGTVAINQITRDFVIDRGRW